MFLAENPIFGKITNPLNTLNSSGYGDLNGTGGGLTAFLSNIIKFITIIAGLFALFNLVSAGIGYISSGGDPKGIEDAKNRIFMSLIGLVIIVAAFSITAIISKLLFGEYWILINPQIYGPGTQ
jgi:hypothetical protein